MLIHRTVCSECRVALGSESGFTVGEPIACPQCKEEFVVKAGKNSSRLRNQPAKTAEVVDVDEDDLPTPPKAKSRPSIVIEDDDEVDTRPKKRPRGETDDDEDEEDLPPRKKNKGSKGKKKGSRRGEVGDEKKSYKNSPIRFVILGLLLVILLVMAYFLYVKKSDEGNTGQRPMTSKLT